MSRVKYKSQLRSDSLLRLFFDFYVMNEVWFRTVGAAHYGYPVTKILPHRKEKVIHETFIKRVENLKTQIVSALEASVRKEINHWIYSVREYFGEKRDEKGDGVPHTSHYYVACKRFGLSYQPKASKLKRLPLETIREMYFTRCWCEDYGGSKWGEATELLIQLKASKTVKDDVYLIDRILDMQHNTGFILNKTVFATLDDKARARRKNKNGKTYPVKPLTFRFSATLPEMVPNCGKEVQNIYTANLRYV